MRENTTGSEPQDTHATEDNAPPDEEQNRRRSTRALTKQAFFIFVLLLGVAAVYLYLSETAHEPTPHQAPTDQVVTVKAITVKPTNVPISEEFLGQTIASLSVGIRARVTGFLIEENFEEGSTVSKGQVLYRIDPRPFEVALSQASAQLKAAQARLDQAKNQVKRYERLTKMQSAAVAEYEEWLEAMRVAQAEVELHRARIQEVELDLDYAVIESPLTGVIGRSRLDVGSYLRATGEEPLATVQQVDPMYVRFSVSETDILRWERLVGAGEISDIPTEMFSVTVLLPDGVEHPYRGRINYVDVEIDPSTGTAVIRASVPNPEFSLRPGQFVTVRITGATRYQAILLPQTAVLQSPGGSYVYVIDEQGSAQERPVEAGNRHQDQWIIESGLEEGTEVIVDHLVTLRSGTPVIKADGSSP